MNIAMAALPGIAVARAAAGLAFDVGRVGGLLGRGMSWGASACRRNSFVAGTMVLTPLGPAPVERLRAGDWVVSRHEDGPHERVVARRVSDVIWGLADEVVWLTLDDGRTLGATPDHELWLDGPGGRTACEIEPGDALLAADGSRRVVVDKVVDAGPTPVFNIEVAGTHTYFAEDAWVHNNSCSLARHGGDLHMLLGKMRFDALVQSGAKNVQWNKALRNSKGKIVSYKRPDIQYVGADGKVHIEEIIVSNRVPNRREEMKNALGTEFGSFNEIRD